jgi:hypothetical protein
LTIVLFGSVGVMASRRLPALNGTLQNLAELTLIKPQPRKLGLGKPGLDCAETVKVKSLSVISYEYVTVEISTLKGHTKSWI